MRTRQTVVGRASLRRYDAAVSSLSDPGRPSRGDRRQVQKLIDAAYAGGRLSAAERSLRTQRVEAAHTRGDLAMIARDLRDPSASEAQPEVAPPVVRDLQPDPGPAAGMPSLGSAIDDQILKSMQVRGAYRGSGAPGKGPAAIKFTGFGNAARTIRIVIVVFVVGFLGICGLGLAVFIPAFVDGYNSETTSSPSAPTEVVTTEPGSGPHAPQPSATSLHTAVGWSALVAAIKDESGTTSIYDLVVYPTYASVGLDGGKTINRRLYRDGAWQDSFKVQTPIVGSPVDLRKIDPKVISRLPAETSQRLGVENPTGTYLIVNALVSDPKIMVYVQADGGSQYQAYSLDGSPRTF